MQLFCNFSFILFFQKGRALARISLFERSERYLILFYFIYFSFLCVLKCRFWGINDALILINLNLILRLIVIFFILSKLFYWYGTIIHLHGTVITLAWNYKCTCMDSGVYEHKNEIGCGKASVGCR